MARHLKTKVFLRLKDTVFLPVPSPFVSTHRARGVRYLNPVLPIKFYYGAMSTVKEGRKYRKHIIVRRVPRYGDLHQLYTYHFPKAWSAACVANRELIKEAQRRAHALEHDHSTAALEWHIRFLKHYFRVFKGGAKPEPGFKPYSRFYQYTYVAIYRELKAASQKAQEPVEEPVNDVTFDPIDQRPLRALRRYPLCALTACRHTSNPPLSVPLWQNFCKIVT